MPEDIYKVRLDKVFEGPMDLLVYLIRKNEVDIYDIPIAKITDRYLKYVELMRSMKIDFAGEFLLMAATLIKIKSRMLLPIHGDDDEEEDPRMEITSPLIEYLRIKSAAEKLSRRDILGENIFKRNAVKEYESVNREDDSIQIGLFELIDAFGKIFARIVPEKRIEFTAERISVKRKIADIMGILEKQNSITFGELFSESNNKSEVIVTFLAILEMVKLSLIAIIQHLQTGIIRICYQ